MQRMSSQHLGPSVYGCQDKPGLELAPIGDLTGEA